MAAVEQYICGKPCKQASKLRWSRWGGVPMCVQTACLHSFLPQWLPCPSSCPTLVRLMPYTRQTDALPCTSSCPTLVRLLAPSPLSHHDSAQGNCPCMPTHRSNHSRHLVPDARLAPFRSLSTLVPRHDCQMIYTLPLKSHPRLL